MERREPRVPPSRDAPSSPCIPGPLIVALAVMGLGLGVAAVPGEKTGSAAGIYSTSRYLGSVAGSSVLALAFVAPPAHGDAGRLTLLYAGLAGVVANTRVAPRAQGTTPLTSRGPAPGGDPARSRRERTVPR